MELQFRLLSIKNKESEAANVANLKILFRSQTKGKQMWMNVKC